MSFPRPEPLRLSEKDDECHYSYRLRSGGTMPGTSAMVSPRASRSRTPRLVFGPPRSRTTPPPPWHPAEQRVRDPAA